MSNKDTLNERYNFVETNLDYVKFKVLKNLNLDGTEERTHNLVLIGDEIYVVRGIFEVLKRDDSEVIDDG